MKHILDYGLELENVKENELPDKDNEIIIQFNNILSEKYGLFEVDVLENDNLYFRGRITSSTKSENNAKLKLLIAELNEFYKKYNLKKVIKSMIAYGHTIWKIKFKEESYDKWTKRSNRIYTKANRLF